MSILRISMPVFSMVAIILFKIAIYMLSNGFSVGGGAEAGDIPEMFVEIA